MRISLRSFALEMLLVVVALLGIGLSAVAAEPPAESRRAAEPATVVEAEGFTLEWRADGPAARATLKISDGTSSRPSVLLFVYDAPARVWVLSRKQSAALRYDRTHPFWSRDSLDEVLATTLGDERKAESVLALFERGTAPALGSRSAGARQSGSRSGWRRNPEETVDKIADRIDRTVRIARRRSR